MLSQRQSPGPRVVIIGSGLGGLSAGFALRQLRFENFTIYERASDVGGTWRDNTYPGCNCDTPSHWYCHSTEPNPNWSVTHAPQPELQTYWKHFAEKYSLYRNTIFNTNVISAAWDAAQQQYNLEVENVISGDRSWTSAEIIISAVGILMDPSFPADINGRETFKGDLFHSARWNPSVDFQHKRVAVIGNAASAAQFIPHLVADPTVHVTNFCRTPQWFVHRDRWEWSPLHKWIFAHVPFALPLHRGWLIWTLDILPAVKKTVFWKSSKPIEEEFTQLIRREAPGEYHNKLIPIYPASCRRAVMDSGYLSCLHLPNFNLNWDGISEITSQGILTKTGESLPFDVVIFATGYVADRHPVTITGTQGTIQEYYTSHGGPTAYRGITIPSFPNLFLVGGPNTVTAGSELSTAETAVNYSMKFIGPVLDGLVSSFEVKSDVTDAYNERIQKKLGNNDFVGCESWFRTGGTGKNFTLFPGSVTEYWWFLRNPIWEDYIAVGGERWERCRQLTRIKRWARTLVFALCLVWMSWSLRRGSVSQVLRWLRTRAVTSC
ncbi:hypothetical protein SCP_0203200 [Sparassis crispa]|uniref:L-ornithine N(5)-monooxygenase [NAD(P)H] n=1 Tax=Sparassis crispa TaxID=139825 RepID=A0A401GAG8_9APHY|nr:hypothetical protein SCP_0203200 [Sparassis crispa]GBE79123.1 hypothetical protein SCP_0203200 [Sparassis crispa]